VVLFLPNSGSGYNLELTQERWPQIRLHAMREHAGLELQA
jgi:hypothetical protein